MCMRHDVRVVWPKFSDDRCQNLHTNDSLRKHSVIGSINEQINIIIDLTN